MNKFIRGLLCAIFLLELAILPEARAALRGSISARPPATVAAAQEMAVADVKETYKAIRKIFKNSSDVWTKNSIRRALVMLGDTLQLEALQEVLCRIPRSLSSADRTLLLAIGKERGPNASPPLLPEAYRALRLSVGHHAAFSSVSSEELLKLFHLSAEELPHFIKLLEAHKESRTRYVATLLAARRRLAWLSQWDFLHRYPGIVCLSLWVSAPAGVRSSGLKEGAVLVIPREVTAATSWAAARAREEGPVVLLEVEAPVSSLRWTPWLLATAPGRGSPAGGLSGLIEISGPVKITTVLRAEDFPAESGRSATPLSETSTHSRASRLKEAS